MQDESDYGNLTFTVQEARALRSRFVHLLLERDRLSAELEAHRQVLAELEDLRPFLRKPSSFEGTDDAQADDIPETPERTSTGTL
jgi:hypothetical protein